MKLRAIALLAVLCLLFSTAAFADEPQPYLNGSVFVDASDGVEVQLTRVRIANKITVRVAVETEDDYLLRGIEIYDEDGKSLPFEVVGCYLYTFDMPRCDVTIHIAAEDYGIVTRADGAVGLWKLAGSPVVDYIMPYDDVGSDAEYAEAVRWAAAEGLLEWNGSFSADKPLTREELAVMIYKYAQSRSLDTTAAAGYELDTIDRAFVSTDAYDGVCYAVASGVMDAENRTAGYFNPQGELFKYEFDGILDRFAKLFDSGDDNIQGELTDET